MKIQLGESIILNRTHKYLLPCLKAYGDTFKEYFNAVHKVAVGTGDMILVESGIRYEKHLFTLIDTSKNKNLLKRFLEWVRDQPMYEDEYAFDSVHTGNLLMVVIKLPESCYKAEEKFKHSQYSKMYGLDDIAKYFSEHPETQRILIQDSNYKIEYASKLSEEWETNVNPEELEGELDLPIRKEEEIFNSIKHNGE